MAYFFLFAKNLQIFLIHYTKWQMGCTYYYWLVPLVSLLESPACYYWQGVQIICEWILSDTYISKWPPLSNGADRRNLIWINFAHVKFYWILSQQLIHHNLFLLQQFLEIFACCMYVDCMIYMSTNKVGSTYRGKYSSRTRRKEKNLLI